MSIDAQVSVSKAAIKNKVKEPNEHDMFILFLCRSSLKARMCHTKGLNDENQVMIEIKNYVLVRRNVSTYISVHGDTIVLDTLQQTHKAVTLNRFVSLLTEIYFVYLNNFCSFSSLD